MRTIATNQIKPNFRYDINALRAIAILGVLLFHFKVDFIQGGFLGVDTFFVISGFLMSKIIITAVDKKQFIFKEYISKRIFRIIPALIFLILILTIVCFFFYFPEDYTLFEKNASASLLFLSNIYYWKHSGYFDASSDTNLLLHTWSLSAEWQFYLIYPLLLIKLNQILKKRSNYISFFICTTLILFIVSTFLTHRYPTASFYLLHTRCWEMLVGGIAFLLQDLIKSNFWKKSAAIIGYILILGSFILVRSSAEWLVLLSVIPVLGTFLVIIGNQNEFSLIRIEIIQFTGKISYSLYLWHWPIYVIFGYYGTEMTLQIVALLVVISYIFGYVSFKYIESIRFNNIKFILATAATMLVCTFSLSNVKLNSIIFKKETVQIAEMQTKLKNDRQSQYRIDTCHATSLKKFNKDICLCLNTGQKNILIIGDSHMGQLSQALREKGKKLRLNFLQATSSAILPTLKDYQKTTVGSREVMDFIFRDFIPKHAEKIDGVIISAYWAGYNNTNDARTPVSDSEMLIGIRETIMFMKKYKIPTIVLGQTEMYTIPYTTIAARNFENGIKNNLKYYDKRAIEMDNLLGKNLSKAYIKLINIKNFPELSNTNTPYMSDSHHVTKYGANCLVDKILSNPKTITFLKAINEKNVIKSKP